MNSAQPDPMRRSALFNRADVAISSPCVALSRSEEHTSELQSPCNLVCRLLLEKKKKRQQRLLVTQSPTSLLDQRLDAYFVYTAVPSHFHFAALSLHIRLTTTSTEHSLRRLIP